MSAPTNYVPDYSYSDYQATNPNTPLPAPRLDNDLAAISNCTGQIITNLGLIQKGDGTIANAVVTPGSLDTATIQLIAASGINTVTVWASNVAYTIGNVIIESSQAYVCALDHTSSESFSDDLSAGDWAPFSSPSTAYSIPYSSGSGAPFPTVGDALDAQYFGYYHSASVVAAASTTDIWTTNTVGVVITGSSTITSLGNAPVGSTTFRFVRFSAGCILSGVIPGISSITTADGDVAIFFSKGSTTDFYCAGYYPNGFDFTKVAKLASPVFTGTPTTSNPVASDYSAQIPTTKWVTDTIQALTPAASGTPSGAVMFFAMNTAPTGWLAADGSAVSRTVYAPLFGLIGTTFGAGDGTTTFNLPDLRGQFVRGFDAGRGVDPTRAFGSNQTGALAAHNHGVTDPTHSHGVSDPGHAHLAATATATVQTYLTTNWNSSAYSTGAASLHSGVTTSASATGITIAAAATGISIQNTGSTENRPVNVALLGCIKT